MSKSWMVSINVCLHSNVKGWKRSGGQLPPDLENNDLKQFLAPNSSASERFSLLGHDLQGQIRGQMTGNAL